ncbi:phage tail tip lysozyme [Enterococcus sulfureus]
MILYPDDVYIYDIDETDFTHNGFPLIDFWEEPEINRKINGRYAFTGEYFKQGQLADLIKHNAVIRAKVPDGSWQKFRISSIEDDQETISFTARFKGLDANRNFIDKLITTGTVSNIMAKVQTSLEFDQPYIYRSNMTTSHQFTVKQNHPIDALIGSNSGGQNLASICSGELDMYDNTFYMKDRIGSDNGFRVDFGINLEYIKETIEESDPPNTLYLVGAVPEGDYDAEREPITLKYLEAPGIKITEENRVIGKYENQDCKTIADLQRWGNEVLIKKEQVHLPKTSHEISVVDLANTIEYEEIADLVKLQLGDTIYGTLQNEDKQVVERVVEYTWYPRLNEYKKLGTGSSVSFYTEKSEGKINTVINKIEQKGDFLQENILNATQLITGNETGNIMQWPKNRPRELRIMDTEDENTAKKVWRWNLGGLGFSNNGVDGPFELAITQDGHIVANFIKVGVLSAIDIEGVNIYGSKIETINDGQYGMLRMQNGTIQFFDKKGKSFGLLTLTNLDKPSILLQHNDGSFFMDADSATLTHSKVINLNAPKVLKNGVEIGSGTPGTGSAGNEGGWNGTYPSVADTQAKKFAWEAWTTLRGLGYSEAAAAGILGNINGEAGPSMNPDTDQIGGPAYGAVQFDGSSSTIVGSPTNDGREYFQRLHKASGVGGDYKTMSVQMAVVNWTMTNGQWIGKINPTTVSGYKAMTDARTAATVFERNFERPASTHPERSNYAQYWYDLFKGVAIEKKDWVNPIRVPYLIWQEWDNIQDDGNKHGGIDITPKNGASSAVYAARAGTVYQVVPNDSVGGNYMVVKHSDGYYTYYGHFASMSAKVGDNVTTDTVLGMSGQTGKASGIHLHFEVWKDGEWQRINPRDVIKF